MIRLLIALVFGIGFSAGPLHAKDVTIEWKPISGAVQYELWIEKADKEHKTVLKKALEGETTQWQGDLPQGLYQYRVRGIDFVKRPGDWTKALPLAVMPPTPEKPKIHAEETKVLRSSTAKAPVQWKKLPGVNTYQVEVIKDGKSVHTMTVQGNEAELPNFGSGKYRVEVKPVLEAKGSDVSENLQGRQWAGKAFSVEEFNVNIEPLAEAKLKSPIGHVVVPKGENVTFQWSAVKGAEAYQFRVAASAAELEKTKPTVVKSNSTDLDLPTEGKYVWDVRPLSSAENQANDAGPKTTANFELERTSGYAGGHLALLSLMGGYAPVEYKSDVALPNLQGRQNLKTEMMGVRGDLWLGPSIGTYVNAQAIGFLMDRTRLFDQLQGGLGVQMRVANPLGVVITGLLGPEARQFLQIVPNTNQFGAKGYDTGNLSTSTLTTVGLSAGIKLSRRLFDRWEFGAQYIYYLPISIFGINGPIGPFALTNDASYRNMNFGASGRYWFKSFLGLELGSFFDFRSVSYYAKPRPDGQQGRPNQVWMDGYSVQGQLIFGW